MGWIPKRKRPLRELAPVRDLLPGVWGLNPTTLSYRLKAYGEHWKESMSLIDDAELTLNFHGNVTELIAIVRENSQGSVENVETAIAGANLGALEHDSDPISVTAALGFSMRLWLFTEPELSDKSLTLRQLVEQKLPKTATPTDLAILHTLSDDFSAKSMTRKGGFRLVWTSYLSEHLTFEGTSSLRVFRHASALQQYASLKSRERELFPDGFLEETERTLSLLFPPANFETSKRIRRISEKEGVDIEAAIDKHASLDLNNYPFWQERLRHVQCVYDKAKPKRIKQWYYDRRDRVEWSTFWIAVVVFLLTLFFGIISSVTSIMQVYASFKAIPSS